MSFETLDRTSAVDPSITWALREGALTYHEAIIMGARPRDFGEGEFSAAELLAAGASDHELTLCGFDPIDIVEDGGTPSLLQDVEPETLAEAKPEPLVDAAEEAGIDSLDDLDSGSITDGIDDILSVLPGDPAQLARTGVSVAEMAGYDLPATEILQAGYLARDLLEAGMEVTSVLEGGAPPSVLLDQDFDRETLERVDLPAGSLRAAGLPVDRLVEAGYSGTELLRGGYDESAIAEAGCPIEAGVKGVSELLEAERHTPSQLRDMGVGPDTLYEHGIDCRGLLAGGYTEGELVDAGVELTELVAANADPGALKAAGVDVQELLDAGVRPAALRHAGTDPEALLEAGLEEARLGLAGFTREELAAAGIDPEEAEAAARELLETAASRHVEGIALPTSEADLYSFSFDPAVSRTNAVSDNSGGERPSTDGGGIATVPDWRVEDSIETWLERLKPSWRRAIDEITNSEGDWDVLDALQRESISRKAQVVGSATMTAGVSEAAADTIEDVGEATGEAYPRIARATFDADEERKLVDDAFVDDDISAFLDVLAEEPLEPLQLLMYEMPEDDVTALYHVLQEVAEVSELPDLPDGQQPAEKRRLVYLAADSFNGALLTLFRIIFEKQERAEIQPLEPEAVAEELMDELGFGGGPQNQQPREAEVEYLEEITVAALERHGYLEDLDDRSIRKFELVAALGAEHGDCGVPRSFARLLFYQATMQAYLAGRLRLGAEYDDPPVAALEVLDADSEVSQLVGELDELFGQPVPESLKTEYNDLLEGIDLLEMTGSLDRTGHGVDTTVDLGPVPQDVDRTFDESDLNPDGGETQVTYDEVLAAAAAEEGQTTELAPELSEFSDSLAHLAALEADEIERLFGETLDVTSHRIDAWWTSLGTKRVFEHRESQREAETQPGLHVGAYGFVEDLSQTDEDDPFEYIHAPSLDQAKTAAVLRSGYNANERTEEDVENPLEVDLSPERVRDAKWLMEGVRRGQSLGELLGYRFERRLHEETFDEEEEEEVDLMQYRFLFREAFPGIVDSLEYLDDTDADIEERRELAKSDVVNGYRLVRAWDGTEEDEAGYPFPDRLEAEDRSLPESGPEKARLEAIKRELEADIDAVSDLLIAEGVHQLGQRNLARASGSLDALARGESLPDPALVEVPRSDVGATHRLNVLLDPAPMPENSDHLRQVGEPTIDAWAEQVLPEHDRVGCQATYRWPGSEAWADQHDEPHPPTREVTLGELDLCGLDIVELGRNPEGAGGSELELWLTYHLRRNRPEGVPPDATIELDLSETGDSAADVTVVTALEIARSVRELLSEGRPASGADFTHPTDPMGPGYLEGDDGTLADLERRADEVQDALEALDDDLCSALSALAPDREDGEVTIGDPVWDVLDDLEAAIDATDLELLDDVVAAVEDIGSMSSLESDLERFATEELTGGVLDPDQATMRLEDAAGQEIGVSFDAPTFVAGQELAVTERIDEPRLGESTFFFEWWQSGAYSTDSSYRIEAGATGSILASPDEVSEDGYVPVVLDEVKRESLEESFSLPFFGDDETDEDAEVEWETETDVEVLLPIEVLETTEPVEPEETVVVLGVEGATPFTAEPSTTVEDGGVTATLDLADHAPGTSVTVLFEVAFPDGTAERTVHHGYVGEALPAAGIDTSSLSGTPVAALCWLAANGDTLLAETGPLVQLHEAIAAIDDDEWSAIKETDAPADVNWSDLDADAPDDVLETVTALEDAAVDELLDGLRALVRWTEALGLDGVVDVMDLDEGYDGVTFRDPGHPRQGVVRARVLQTLGGAAPFLPTVPPDSLRFAPGVLDWVDAETADAEERASVLEALDDTLPPSEATLSTVAETEDTTIEGLARLHEWCYDPATVESGATIEDELETVVESDTALAEPIGETDHSFAPLSAGLAAARDHVRGNVDGDEDWPSLETVVEEVATLQGKDPVGASFRLVTLEHLRGILTEAARAGIYGAVPSAPVDTSPEAVAQVVESAVGVRETLQERLAEGKGLDPATADFDGLSTAQQVDTQQDRIEALLGEGFVAFPRFAPPNHPELSQAYESPVAEDKRLLEGLGPLAVETWFQRTAQVQPGAQRLRESISYSEAVSKEFERSLHVAQLPYRTPEAGDYTWIGADGAWPTGENERDIGRVSIVTQYANGADETSLEDGVVGLFVDEWVEKAPDETVTTGVAIGADEPTNRPPQTMLLAAPPSDGSWSTGGLVETVTESMEYASYRSIDTGDLEELVPLLPTLAVPWTLDNFGGERDRPLSVDIDLDILDWSVPWRPPSDSLGQHRAINWQSDVVPEDAVFPGHTVVSEDD